MFRSFTRKLVPVVTFGAGLISVPPSLREGKLEKRDLMQINTDVLLAINSTTAIQEIRNRPGTNQYNSSELFPKQHRQNYVGTGLLYGPELFEIDPIVFQNISDKTLASVYYLGNRLVSQDGQVHNGVISTIIDEGLCSCGFPFLPSKRGVTASLEINFKEQAEPGSVVLLRSKVSQASGRKVTIEGFLETLPLNENEKSRVIAESKCILVEPKWFSYFSWFKLI